MPSVLYTILEIPEDEASAQGDHKCTTFRPGTNQKKLIHRPAPGDRMNSQKRSLSLLERKKEAVKGPATTSTPAANRAEPRRNSSSRRPASKPKARVDPRPLEARPWARSARRPSPRARSPAKRPTTDKQVLTEPEEPAPEPGNTHPPSQDPSNRKVILADTQGNSCAMIINVFWQTTLNTLNSLDDIKSKVKKYLNATDEEVKDVARRISYDYLHKTLETNEFSKLIPRSDEYVFPTAAEMKCQYEHKRLLNSKAFSDRKYCLSDFSLNIDESRPTSASGSEVTAVVLSDRRPSAKQEGSETKEAGDVGVVRPKSRQLIHVTSFETEDKIYEMITKSFSSRASSGSLGQKNLSKKKSVNSIVSTSRRRFSPTGPSALHNVISKSSLSSCSQNIIINTEQGSVKDIFSHSMNFDDQRNSAHSRQSFQEKISTSRFSLPSRGENSLQPLPVEKCDYKTNSGSFVSDRKSEISEKVNGKLDLRNVNEKCTNSISFIERKGWEDTGDGAEIGNQSDVNSDQTSDWDRFSVFSQAADKRSERMSPIECKFSDRNSLTEKVSERTILARSVNSRPSTRDNRSKSRQSILTDKAFYSKESSSSIRSISSMKRSDTEDTPKTANKESQTVLTCSRTNSESVDFTELQEEKISQAKVILPKESSLSHSNLQGGSTYGTWSQQLRSEPRSVSLRDVVTPRMGTLVGKSDTMSPLSTPLQASPEPVTVRPVVAPLTPTVTTSSEVSPPGTTPSTSTPPMVDTPPPAHMSPPLSHVSNSRSERTPRRRTIIPNDTTPQFKERLLFQRKVEQKPRGSAFAQKRQQVLRLRTAGMIAQKKQPFHMYPSLGKLKM